MSTTTQYILKVEKFNNYIWVYGYGEFAGKLLVDNDLSGYEFSHFWRCLNSQRLYLTVKDFRLDGMAGDGIKIYRGSIVGWSRGKRDLL